MALHSAAPRFPWDALERILWTGAESAVALGAVWLAEVDTWWALPIGVAVATLKTLIAKRLGQSGTASTLPASKDPAAPVRFTPATGRPSAP